MKVEYSARFLKDIQSIKSKEQLLSIDRAINELKSAQNLRELPHVKKLGGTHNAFRLRVGDYRIGFFQAGDVVCLHRCLDRKDIYRSFP
jgi:mRNA-degrading endonuclease RelE of RelBE toxin-antitoxin system